MGSGVVGSELDVVGRRRRAVSRVVGGGGGWWLVVESRLIQGGWTSISQV